MEVLGVAAGVFSAIAAIVVLALEVIRGRKRVRVKRMLVKAGVLIAGMAALVWAVRGK